MPAEPAVEGLCTTPDKKETSFKTNFIHSSGVRALRICGGLDIKGHARFEPGLYIIDEGDLSINANGEMALDEASMAGEGVTFYLANGATLSLNGNGNFRIQAPTTAPYAGILFFGSRSAGRDRRSGYRQCPSGWCRRPRAEPRRSAARGRA
ncbi:hypothetical protein KTN05_15845 [Paracoccus sp. Z118]|uniref:hypothetical protein n=1 Tax=Paracoccus sp. Z118 TaxID=2851017 RepID=UPI001C2BD83C|nr:hypothetical protein [Paracoccus sp. Z118]MBV0893284.1 hypothetical protein [Paracoccus sp. Z118]